MADDMIQPERPDPRDITRRPIRSADEPRRLDDVDDLPRLGSLAQSARNKHLKQARNTLLVVGILMTVIQAVMYFVELGQIEKAGAGVNLDEARMILMLFHGGAIAIGILFIVLSFFVEKYPVAITVVALTVFVAEQIVFIVVDVENIYRGIILKIIVVVALVKALQAGLAAQKDAQSAAMFDDRFDD